MPDAALANGAPSGARCSLHPERAAAMTCSRCGVFICADDARILGGTAREAKTYCPSCAERPEIDYLEAFRQKCWGKRDVWAWLLGTSALLFGAAGLFGASGSIQDRDWGGLAFTGGLLAQAAVQGCYFFGLRWTRLAVLAIPAAAVVLSARLDPASSIVPAIAFLVLFGAYFDTRNRLFFRVEVSRTALHKAWDLFANNSLARAGYLLGFASLLLGVLAPIGLVLSIIGLSRVNPEAHPPIGRKGQAIAGIVLSSLSLAGWGALLLFSLLRK